MGLLVCFACGRQREVKPIKKGKTYTCSNCHARQIRIIRSKAHASYISWSDKEGISEYEAKHQIMAYLKHYQERKGYKNGWSAHKFKALFARWPNGEASELPAPPSSEFNRWIRKQNADYRKRRKAEESRLADAGSWVSGRVHDSASISHSLMTDDDWGIKL